MAELCVQAGPGKQPGAAAAGGGGAAVQLPDGGGGGGSRAKVRWQIHSGGKPDRHRTPTPPPAHLLPTHGSHGAAAAGGVAGDGSGAAAP